MEYVIKKNKGNRDFPYRLSVGTSKWGLKKHHMNPKYYFAVPTNVRSKGLSAKKSPFMGIWFYQVNGVWSHTKSPPVWVGQ